jgi:hypothetical protein
MFKKITKKKNIKKKISGINQEKTNTLKSPNKYINIKKMQKPI